MHIFYFSSVSNTTKKFVDRLNLPATRLPLTRADDHLVATEPFVLITPTYGGGSEGGAVPKQVIRFLSDPQNKELIRGVIGAGNRNFGTSYCAAADVVAQKCRTPVLYRFELLGTAEDIASVSAIITNLA